MTTKKHDETLASVWVALPNHWATRGESFWATVVGPDLYELRNVPFHAYGLNFGDVVRAVSRAAEQKPEIVAVVTPSGHRTLRVFFTDKVALEQRGPLLAELRPFGATFENANGMLFAIDVEADGDYVAVCESLWAWEQEGFLQYETCEARLRGSFDDVQEDGAQ